MATTGCITRNQNHNDDDDASSSSSRKRLKTSDNNGGVASWSDLNHDVLFLVMMQLRVDDFLAFSVVCKSWSSLALSNRITFMASRPPMSIILINSHASSQDSDKYCYLEDPERRRFKTIIPHSAGRRCIGLTCGYLILFRRKTCDFWLVNPITRQELHFPHHPSYVGAINERVRCILVFSPSISGWVFVMLYKRISFYVAGKRRWNHVSSTVPIVDIHFFKGKIYTLHTNCSLGELRLAPKRRRKWTLLKTKIFLNPPDLYRPLLLSLDENIYMIDESHTPQKFLKLDFGKMEWVLPEKTIGEYAFFFSYINYFAAIRPKSWAGPPTHYKICDKRKSRLCLFSYDEGMWYFPPDCLIVNMLDE